MNHAEIYGITVVVIYILGALALVGGNDLNKYFRWILWSIISVLSATLLFKLIFALILE